MPQFAFVARDRFGTAREGWIDEASHEAAMDALRQRNWLVLDMRPAGAGDLADLWNAVQPSQWLPVRLVDIELGLRQLSVMLASGLALLDALRLLAENANRRAMSRVWQQVAEDVLAGQTLAAAIERHRCFPAVVVQLTRVGEQTGELHETHRRAVELLEQRRKLRSQILAALAYPVVVFFTAIGVAGFMVFEVIPKLQRFLESLGRNLPAMTRMLVDVTNFANEYALHGAVALIVLLVLLVAIRSWPPGRLWTDRALLRVPVVGATLRTAGSASVARNMQTLLQSGVSLLDSLRSVELLLGNRFLAQEMARARADVFEGRTLARALADHRGFDAMLPRIIAIGESSGRLDDVLGEAATYFEDELSRAIRKLAALIEPAMLVVVGGIVGFVYIAFFMALFAAAG